MTTTLLDRTEAAEYYFTYIDQVPKNDDIRRIIDTQLGETLSALSAISGDRVASPVCAGQVEHSPGRRTHLNDTERMFVFRALWFARGLGSQLPSFDQDVAIAGGALDDRPLATSSRNSARSAGRRCVSSGICLTTRGRSAASRAGNRSRFARWRTSRRDISAHHMRILSRDSIL